jgi:tetratricopeptide (TPR) repeat protein
MALLHMEPRMDNALNLRLLGRPQLSAGQRILSLSTHQVALLSLFALNKCAGLERGYIARLLWPKSSSASARHSLSQAVYALKAAYPNDQIITGSRTHVRVAELTTDYAAFMHAYRQEDWRTAERLFQGELMEGVDLPHAEELGELIDSRRREVVNACLDVARGLQLDGCPREAAHLLERTSKSHSVSLQLATTLQLKNLSAGFAELPPPPHHDYPRDDEPTPFVGRVAEMESLEEQYNRVRESGFRAVIIEGESGIGKSALARRFSRLWVLRGGLVARATGFVAERNLPFGVVAQWLRDGGQNRCPVLEEPWASLIEEAFPGTFSRPNRSSPESDIGMGEFRLLEALRRYFGQFSADRPLLLLLDDAHYCDATSLAFAHYFSRRSKEAPVLFLAAVRTPSLDVNDPFEGWPGADRIVLGPLSDSDTAKLVSRLADSRSKPEADSVSRLRVQTGGNPLLILSLLGSSAQLEPPEVPDTILEFFRPRLGALSSHAGVVMAALSVIGDIADQDVVAGISGLANDPPRMSAAIAELKSAGLVTTDDHGGLHPRHGIVADIAVTAISAADRRALYGRAARVLAESGRSSPAVLAIQHDIAGDRANAFEAASSAALASQQLHATREQEFFLKLAISNAPNKEAEVSIRIILADLYRRTGRSTEALNVVSDATLTGGSQLQRSRARASRLAVQLLTAEPRIPPQEVWDEIEELSKVLERALIAELYLHFAVAGRDHGDRQPTVEAATRALSIAQGLPRTPHNVIIAVRAANILGLWEDAAEGLATIQDFFSTADSNAEVLGQCLSAQASLLVCLGKLIEAEEKFLKAMELIERHCMYDALFALHNNLGICYTELGRYAEAQRQLEEAARVGVELGRQRSTLAAENLAMLHLERGEFELALRTVRGAMTRATTRSPRELFHRHALIGLCSLELGLLAQAFEAKREIDLLFQHHEYWGSDVSYVETFLARMLVMEGQPDVARARLEAAAEIYRTRDLLCLARLELERVRIDLKTDPAGALERAESMLGALRGTGARPLVDRFEDLADRARRHAR